MVLNEWEDRERNYLYENRILLTSGNSIHSHMYGALLPLHSLKSQTKEHELSRLHCSITSRFLLLLPLLLLYLPSCSLFLLSFLGFLLPIPLLSSDQLYHSWFLVILIVLRFRGQKQLRIPFLHLFSHSYRQS